MTSRRTTPSLSRLLAVAAGTLSIGFASTAFAQRAGTHPVPISAAPRMSPYPSQQPRHPRNQLLRALRRGGHAPATRPGSAKPRGLAPPKARRAPALAPAQAQAQAQTQTQTQTQTQQAPAPVPQVAAPVQPQVAAPVQPQVAAPVQSQVVAPAPAQQAQPSPNAAGSSLQSPAQAPTPSQAATLGAPAAVVSGGS